MHRAIDRFTDLDPDVKALNQRIAVRHGRYAGVLSDIAFDYFLWRNWEQFGPLPFDAFADATYLHLQRRRELMAPRVQGYVDGMVKDNWLRLYTTPQGMQLVFNRLKPRLSRPEKLKGIEYLLDDFDSEFNHTFLLLFPRLQDLANAYRTDSPPTN